MKYRAKGMEKRIDFERNTLAINVYNEMSRKKGENTGILGLPEVEDYELDTHATGYTNNGDFDRIPVEFKTITDRFGVVTEDGEHYGEFYHNKACRGKMMKWHDEWDDTGQPLHYINWAKYEKLIKGHGALIFITEHGEIVFNQKALKRALVGRMAVWAKLTTEFGGKSGWEDKAVLDMSKNSEFINYEFPREYWHDKFRDSK